MRRLLDVLREDLALTGTKEGCGEGECGACTVLLDGAAVDACLVPICQVAGADIRTVEGLAAPAEDPPEPAALDPLQAAFLVTGGAQCGICTPGQVVAATALLAETPEPDEDEVREWMTGNLCRCTGYYGIVQAVLAAAGRNGPIAIRPPIEEAAPATPATDRGSATHQP